MSKRKLIVMDIKKDYLALPYTFELIPDDGEWFIRVKEFPGCMSQGIDPNNAIVMIYDAMALWIETAIDDGTPVPLPEKM